jgi:hypothetical protein
MPEPPVALRPLPYPYRAALAICSDLDETPDRGVYREIMRYLNTCEETAMGPGVGLEIGNSIYFDMPPAQFSYANTDDAGRAMVCDLIRSGHLDCLHSFGDLATTREQARRALDELARRDCRLEVWVDHAISPTNFGQDIMRGEGDLPGARAYHADLSCAFGITYVWRGRVTSVIGQNVPRTLDGLFDREEPLRSGATVLKEWAKGRLGSLGSAKYAMHGSNRLLRRSALRDGREILEFLRFEPSCAGVGCNATAAGVAEVLTEPMLGRLEERGAVGVLYTHLGKIADPRRPFGRDSCNAFARLARHAAEGRILVTTTRRLLGYERVKEELLWDAEEREGCLAIRVEREARSPVPWGPGDCQGLTWYLPDPGRARLWLNGREVVDLQRNGPDETGRRSVSLPWKKLEFPRL